MHFKCMLNAFQKQALSTAHQGELLFVQAVFVICLVFFVLFVKSLFISCKTSCKTLTLLGFSL